MANRKISELVAATALAGTEVVPVVQDGATKKVTVQGIADLAGPGGSTTLDGLTDVTVTTPASGQVLKYDGTTWVNGGAQPGVYHVDDYGATGDGTTDDTTAINNAIAALTAGGGGVLQFGFGDYKTSGNHVITVPATVRGLGKADALCLDAPTIISCTSPTAICFDHRYRGGTYEYFFLRNTASSTPTAGAGIATTVDTAGNGITYENLSIKGFWINIDHRYGANWFCRGNTFWGPVKYGLKIQNISLTDGGDGAISDNMFCAADYNADAAVRWESGGGCCFVNNKVNAYGTAKFKVGYSGEAAAMTVDTSIFQVIGRSIENVSQEAINFTVTGSGKFAKVIITGVEFGLYGNGSYNAIKLSGTSTNPLKEVIIDDCNFYQGNVTPTVPAVSLTYCDGVAIGQFTRFGFTADYVTSNVTNLKTAAGGLTIQEVDGSPTGLFTTLKVPNGSLTDNGDGSATLTVSGGSAHYLQVTQTAVFSDNFNRADGALGSSWSTVSGTVAIVSNQAKGTAVGMSEIKAVGVSTADLTLEATLSAGTSNGSQVRWRVVDDNNFYLLAHNTNNGTVYKVVAGAATVVGSVFTPSTTGTARYRVVHNGSSLTVYELNTSTNAVIATRLTATENSISSAGTIGFRLDQNMTADDVAVYTATGAAGVTLTGLPAGYSWTLSDGTTGTTSTISLSSPTVLFVLDASGKVMASAPVKSGSSVTYV